MEADDGREMKHFKMLLLLWYSRSSKMLTQHFSMCAHRLLCAQVRVTGVAADGVRRTDTISLRKVLSLPWKVARSGIHNRNKTAAAVPMGREDKNRACPPRLLT